MDPSLLEDGGFKIIFMDDYNSKNSKVCRFRKAVNKAEGALRAQVL